MRKNEEVHSAKFIQNAGYVLIGGLLSLGLCVVIIFLCSIGISSGWINPRVMTQCMIISCLISSFLGAMFSIHYVSSKALFAGLLTACVQFLFILLIGFIAFPEISFPERGINIAAGSLVGSLLAAFMIRKPKKKRRK